MNQLLQPFTGGEHRTSWRKPRHRRGRESVAGKKYKDVAEGKGRNKSAFLGVLSLGGWSFKKISGFWTCRSPLQNSTVSMWRYEALFASSGLAEWASKSQGDMRHHELRTWKSRKILRNHQKTIPHMNLLEGWEGCRRQRCQGGNLVEASCSLGWVKATWWSKKALKKKNKGDHRLKGLKS